MPLLVKARIVFDTVALLLFIWMAYEANGFARLARIFPFTIALIAVALGAINLAMGIYLWRTGSKLVADDAPKTAVSAGGEDDDAIVVTGVRRALYYIVWTVAYFGLIGLIGLIPATFLWIAAFLYFEAKAKPVLLTVGTLSAVVGLLLVSNVLDLRWPESMFEVWPW